VIIKYCKLSVSLFSGILIFLTSCQKKDEVAVVLLTPFELVINNVHPAEVVSMVVDCQSPVELKQFTVTSRLEGDFSKVEFDTLISGKKFYLRYEYIVPDLIESSQVLLEFTLRDIEGGVATNVKIIEVISEARYLKETSGHELFSEFSGKQNAYDILNGIPLYSHLADSSKMQIADTSNSTVLLRRWISPSGATFVKFNGFDYANCTNISIRNGFVAGIKTEYIENLTIGDIYIARVINTDKSETYVAIKMVNIVDDPGSEWDRYIFNLKK
jgi:hypothetical protein